MISLKTPEEIEVMREGGKIAARILNLLGSKVRPGITTEDLDSIAAEEIAKSGAEASFLGHAGYPSSICTSVDSEVVHGIPSKRVLREGEIIGLDLGILFKGFHTDTAITVPVGGIDYQAKELIKITRLSLDEGLTLVKADVHLGDIQHRIQKIIEGAGYSVIRDLAGHGIGRELQENPSIPNFGKEGSGPVLKVGMVLAFEPMVAIGDWHVKILKDGWTVATIDTSLAAHFEHTVAVTKNGCEVLTKI